ncbi:MAG: hypothetical protein B7Z68_06110 [Acidobacteria bacterium 21-70-11]|nr:MAG: hypothetical protein B7Z68_06110 [Acidobacteria bacterium 21-70-11]OYW06666.1 MAG: hypothetical protein B7Z61_01675 [Acidobacteria bacterium 37-71-11]HQU34817.1 hypothetical protein [Thermoanaerobaculaceae bacterium]
MERHFDLAIMVFQARQLYEADMVAAALEEAGIRQIRKVEGSRAGSLYRIFVASEVEAQARSIVATISADEWAKVGKAPSERVDRARPQLRAIAVAVFVIVVVGGFALVVLGWLRAMRGH